MANEDSWSKQLGALLKKKRGKETLEHLAANLGLTKDVLENLENGDLGALSLGDFRQILRDGYGVSDPAALPVGSTRSKKSWILIRDQGTPFREWDGKTIRWKFWLTKLQDGKMCPEILVLPPRRLKSAIGRTQEGQHAGEELLYTLSGKVKVHLWEQELGEYGPPFELSRGDILHFHSQVKHFVENGSTSYEAVLLVVRVAA